jgi:hypothetical protein
MDTAETPATVTNHHLVIRQLPGDVTRAECSCGAWMEDQLHPTYWHWSPESGHTVHVHLAGLAKTSAAAHLAEAQRATASVDAAIARMIATTAEADQ